MKEEELPRLDPEPCIEVSPGECCRALARFLQSDGDDEDDDDDDPRKITALLYVAKYVSGQYRRFCVRFPELHHALDLSQHPSLRLALGCALLPERDVLIDHGGKGLSRDW